MMTRIHACECGLKWKLTKQKTSFGIRDDDSLHCTCGRELIRWNGAHIWTGEVVSASESTES
jgi:hypothetical protein